MADASAWRVERAKLIAETVWHNPCGGNVDLRFAIVESPPVAPGELVRTVDEVGGHAVPNECRITITSPFNEFWPIFCTTVLHEYGHVAGFQDPSNGLDPWHSRNEFSVMHAEPDVDPRCERRGRPFLERAGVLRKPRS